VHGARLAVLLTLIPLALGGAIVLFGPWFFGDSEPVEAMPESAAPPRERAVPMQEMPPMPPMPPTEPLPPLAPATGALQGEPFFLGGIQVNEADHQHWVERLQAVAMNTVSVTVYGHQGNWDTDHLWFDQENDYVLQEIRTAKAAGLKVVLILRMAVDHAYPENRFLWHGMIMPRTDDQVRSWFAQYSAFATEWAAIARREGVDLLGVASEMNAMTSTLPIDGIPNLEDFYLDPLKQGEYKENILRHGEVIEERHLWAPGPGERARFDSLEELVDAEVAKKARWAAQVTFLDEETTEAERVERINDRRRLLQQGWVEVLAAVRQEYAGPLTYAANFDQYHLVGFWQHLDVMGINAYFPLRKSFSDDETPLQVLAALTTGWRGVLDKIDGFRREAGVPHMPVVFTELGYTYRRHSTVEPWASTGFSIVYPEPDETAPEDPAPEKQFVVWPDQPVYPVERALALRALRQATAVAPGMLQGILYWKLSTEPSHRAVEPFVLLIDETDGGDRDPLLAELQSFQR